ncbi:hypothetical protein PIB30_098532 [Stylosanthes scabra]|uniref:Uncharacterized protein n=1 Tax=Stylosanthes scabra TaxID=79078 RepID=A0ABU6UW93_9FABA|nr:hypothetical protein [Stylosanthes scabra]
MSLPMVDFGDHSGGSGDPRRRNRTVHEIPFTYGDEPAATRGCSAPQPSSSSYSPSPRRQGARWFLPQTAVKKHEGGGGFFNDDNENRGGGRRTAATRNPSSSSISLCFDLTSSSKHTHTTRSLSFFLSWWFRRRHYLSFAGASESTSQRARRKRNHNQNTNHLNLQSIVTFDPELRSSHRLRLREAHLFLFDSIRLIWSSLA